VPWGEAADLAIINTCTVTHEADAKSRKMLRQFIRKNPGAYTAVIGCYAQMGAKILSEIEGVDLIVGSQEKLNVLDYVHEGKNSTPLVVRDRMDKDDFEIAFDGSGPMLTSRANLKIQDGCDFMCSFCIIPFARGRARSRTLENLLEEARSLVARGAREVVLTGVNIATYAWQGNDILKVVEALRGVEGLDRIRISSIEPTTIPETLFEWMADPEHPLVPHLHIPLQAGSDNILQAMRRKYSRQEFLDFIKLAHDLVPDINIGSDIMVGFPGESEADFEETCEVLWKSPLVYAHVFKYSERPGTASVRIEDKIDPRVMNARSARLRKLAAEKSQMYQEQYLGQTLQVLFEQEQDGYWLGYTPNYLRVAVQSDDDLHNQIIPVGIQEIRGDLVLGTLCPSPVLQ
jgi:threonylcarbamoyladenosine tRNA methylthiotransferase MtaB